MSTEPVISLRGVTFSYGGVPALEDVNLSVGEREAVSIVGPNGGGKTTLVKLILGLLRPQRGEVRVFGQPPQRARLRAGYMPQRVQHDPQFPVTVMDIVLMGRLGQHSLSGLLGWHGRVDRHAALDALAQVGMADFYRRSFAELSGGQRQRVLIARALCCQPDLLLLDEPTSNVDSLVEAQLLELLRQLNQQMTILMVSHDLGFVSGLVESVICVNRRVVVHPTSQLTGAVIRDLYGGEVRMVRHDEFSPSDTRMIDFLRALNDPDVPFLRYALLVGLLASVSLGIVGSYVVTRRITYIAAAISHCVLGGIGVAFYLNVAIGLAWCHPLYGALAAALLSAVIIGLVSLYARQREDTVISAVWAIGMAIGLVFFAKTPGYVDPMSYLFGNILLISTHDVWLVIVMDVVVVALGLGFYPKLLALCFDEEFAELRGVKVKLHYMLLLCLTALTVVLLVRVVGIVLVIALLTLPAAVAGHFARRLWQMMAVAVFCCMVFVTAGIAVSYPLNLPSGPVIILIAGAAYLLVTIAAQLRRRHAG